MPKQNRSRPELSLVIPLYNEEHGISSLFSALNKLAPKLPKKTEVIFVDDGSRDRTAALIKKSPLKYRKHIIELSRNFGHQAALLAGLEESTGKLVVTLDGDLQHPPELIPQMLKQHRKGINIVLTQRIDQGNTPYLKRVTASLFYRLINLVSETKIGENGSDFRSMDRQSVDTLLSLPERRKFLRGMVQWIGFSSVILPFVVKPRKFGESKYSLLKMFTLALHGLTSFSVLPLYAAGFFSFLLFVFAGVYAFYVVYIRLVTGEAVSGWASILLVLLTVGGFLSFFLGLIGVYVAAMYDELKRRPIYIMKRKS